MTKYTIPYDEFFLAEGFDTFIERNRNKIEKIYSILKKTQRFASKVLQVLYVLIVAGSAIAGIVWLIDVYMDKDEKKRLAQKFVKESNNSDDIKDIILSNRDANIKILNKVKSDPEISFYFDKFKSDGINIKNDVGIIHRITSKIENRLNGTDINYIKNIWNLVSNLI